MKRISKIKNRVSKISNILENQDSQAALTLMQLEGWGCLENLDYDSRSIIEIFEENLCDLHDFANADPYEICTCE